MQQAQSRLHQAHMGFAARDHDFAHWQCAHRAQHVQQAVGTRVEMHFCERCFAALAYRRLVGPQAARVLLGADHGNAEHLGDVGQARRLRHGAKTTHSARSSFAYAPGSFESSPGVPGRLSFSIGPRPLAALISPSTRAGSPSTCDQAKRQVQLP